MKCAKCGNEVSADSPCCPWCASGAKPPEPEKRVRHDRCCPVCGSEGTSAGSIRHYSGCGCLPLPGGSRRKTKMICQNCGSVWERETNDPLSFCGCFFWLIFWILFILILKAIF